MRKIFIIILVIIMLLNIASCNNENGGEISSDPTSEISQTESITESPLSDFTETIKDLNGKTIKLASFWDEWVSGDHFSPEQQEAVRALREIERDYNVTIETVSLNVSTYEQDINTTIAAGVIYANIIALQTEHFSIVYSGNIADVKSIESLGLDNNKWNTMASENTTIGNRQYGVGFNMSQQDSINRNLLIFNKELAARFELEDLYQIVRDGEWTFEKFEEISREVLSKSGGSVLPLINAYPCLNNFVFANNAELVIRDNNRYVFNGTSPNVLSALQYLQDYNRNGYLNTRDFVGDNFGLTEANVFMARGTMFLMADYWKVPQIFASGMPDDYGLLPLPKGPNATDYVGVVTNTRFFSFINGDPDIDAAATVLVAMANRTGITNEEWIDRQSAFALRDDESIDMLEIIVNNPVSVRFQTIMGYDYIIAVNDMIKDLSQTPRQAMESISQIAQARLDEHFGQ